jgi:hypothetical protein
MMEVIRTNAGRIFSDHDVVQQLPLNREGFRAEQNDEPFQWKGHRGKTFAQLGYSTVDEFMDEEAVRDHDAYCMAVIPAMAIE